MDSFNFPKPAKFANSPKLLRGLAKAYCSQMYSFTYLGTSQKVGLAKLEARNGIQRRYGIMSRRITHIHVYRYTVYTGMYMYTYTGIQCINGNMGRKIAIRTVVHGVNILFRDLASPACEC